MQNEVQAQNINHAIEITNELIPLVREAESKFKGARNWGVIDILGGGLITDLIKHSKLNSAGNLMNRINYKLGELRGVLGGIQAGGDYSMHVGGLVTFADIFFDGALSDIWMESKILSSLSEVKKLRHKIEQLRSDLLRMRG